MARKFITDRELRLIDSWSRELIQVVSEQWLVYYPLLPEQSQVDDLYEEALLKEYAQPVLIYGRVEFNQTATTAGKKGLDASYTLDVKLHVQECNQRNLRPREGDFIEYGQVVFEVTTVSYAQPVFGQVNDKLSYALTCVTSREGQFQADNLKSDGVDNTHPVQPPRPRTLGDDL